MALTKDQMLADLAARSQRLVNDPAARAAAVEREREQRLQAFEARMPGSAEWLRSASARGFDFAADMLMKIRRGEKLTDNQTAAIERCMLKSKQMDEQRAANAFREQEQAAPVDRVNLEAVEQAFARAKGQGIKWPKLTLDGFQLKPAGETSRNAGAIYVTEGDGRDGLYLGRVMRGQFLPASSCTDELKAGVLAAMADPMASAIAYGKKFGKCAVCHRELSDPESIAAGIGPICSSRMFGG